MTVIVGTWNLENLFRPEQEFGAATQDVYQAKLRGLAATVNGMSPDVLAVQEVGDEAALADLVGLLDGTWHSALSKHFDPRRPIRVGFLSRHPLETVADVTDFPLRLAPLQADDNPAKVTTRMGRGALAVRVRPGTTDPLILVSCHLKSKLLSFPALPGGRTRFVPRDEGERARYAGYALYRRTAEAITVREIADTLLAGEGRERRLVLMGDLNDEPTAATTQILYGPQGSELGTPGVLRPDNGDAWRLWNLAPLIPAAERFSRIYRGRGELIDHILVSRALIENVERVRTIGERDLVSVTDNPADRRTARDSDHAPVVAALAG